MTAAIASIICSVLMLIGTIYTVNKGNEKTLEAFKQQSSENDIKLEAKLSEFKAVTETQIKDLTRKVEKHNNLIERTYKLEGQVAELQHKLQGGGKQ